MGRREKQVIEEESTPILGNSQKESKLVILGLTAILKGMAFIQLFYRQRTLI